MQLREENIDYAGLDKEVGPDPEVSFALNFLIPVKVVQGDIQLSPGS